MTVTTNDLTALAARMQEAQAEEQYYLLWDAFRLLELWDTHDERYFEAMLDAEGFESAALMLIPDGWLVMAINAGCNNPTAPDFNKATALVGKGTREAIGDAEPIEAGTMALALASAALLAHVENQSHD